MPSHHVTSRPAPRRSACALVLALLLALGVGGGVAWAKGHAALARRAERATPRDGGQASGVGPCPDTTLMPTASDIARIARSTLCLINQQRRRYGLVPLVENSDLDRAALGHSQDMVAHGYFDHDSPSGSTPTSRMIGSGYISNRVGYEIGENIAWGTLNLATPQSIVTAWMNSPPHRANILRPQFRQTGLGIVAAVPSTEAQGQPGATYTQDFGVILG